MAPLHVHAHIEARSRIVTARVAKGKALKTKARWFSVSADALPLIDKEELKKRMEEGSVLVVDVREPEEVRETGPIEIGGNSALNVPLGLILQEPSVLTWNPEEFFEEFDDRLPSKQGGDRAIVFSCRSGVRAGQASLRALELGFSDVVLYKGSALDWFSD